MRSTDALKSRLRSRASRRAYVYPTSRAFIRLPVLSPRPSFFLQFHLLANLIAMSRNIELSLYRARLRSSSGQHLQPPLVHFCLRIREGQYQNLRSASQFCCIRYVDKSLRVAWSRLVQRKHTFRHKLYAKLYCS